MKILDKIISIMWVGMHVIYIYAYSFSNFPNQIYWIYIFIFFLASNLIILLNLRKIMFIFKPIWYFLLYILGYYMVSMWELYPGQSIKFIPTQFIQVFLILIFSYVGLLLNRRVIVSVNIYLSYLIIVWTIIQLTFFKNDFSRYGYGSLAMVVVPFLIAHKRYIILTEVIFTMLISQSITTLIASFISISSYLLIYYNLNILKAYKDNSKFIKIFLISCVAFYQLFDNYIKNTFSKILNTGLSVSGTDDLRSYIVENSWRLLLDSHGLGIGYWNFYAWSAENSDFFIIDRLGVTIYGENLHNTYMTWALEGGILVLLPIAFLLVSCVLKIHYIYLIDKKFGSIFYSIFISILIFGVAHQLHELPQFWGTIGLVYGVANRINKINLS